MDLRPRLLTILLHVLLVLPILSAQALQPGDAVREASDILHRIKSSSVRGTGATKPTGFTYYAKQLLNALFFSGPLVSSSDSASLSPPLAKAVRLLEGAADQGSADALFMLAEMNFFGNWTHPRNYSEAFRRYEQLAALNGNASAQHMVGFMYATGVGGAVQQDQAKATLYYTFAADQGDVRAAMVMGYRHHIGIAVPRNCEDAVTYYRLVADEAIKYIRSGPPGNHAIVKQSRRIADDEGGVYGEGASVSSAGLNARHDGPQSDAHASFEDVLEYLDLLSRKGDLRATLNLGKLHYEGARGSPRDLNQAKKYFLDVARRVWTRKGKRRTDVSPGVERLAANAAGYLGRMFLRGEGMQQDFDKARTWLRRGITQGDALSQYSLGLMYLHGYGVPKDPVKAADYFGAAADQDLASAQVRLGVLFLDQGDVPTAMRYFELAERNGHIEAFYYLAEMTHQGIGRDKSCGLAAVYYKIVAEKAEALVASFREANEAYAAGDVETALIDNMLAAEQGFEAAQANVAYLLDRARPRTLSIAGIVPIAKQAASSLLSDGLALLYWTRSGRQNNIDSLVKMGDYYLAGIGTAADAEKAAQCYQAAAESMQSAQALWNLGWMHENGVGIEQDFHLAKRFYDQALETNREAYLPVKLALLKLRARSLWNTLSHGSVRGIASADDDEDSAAPRRRRFSFAEWLQAFLENEERMYYGAGGGADYDQQQPGDDWDEFQPAAGIPGADELYDELGDGFFESFAIVACALALAALVVYRRRRADERERDELRRNGQGGPQQQQQQQHGGGGGGNGNAQGERDRGLFPQPGDPEFLGWAAGGVGH